MRNQPIQIYAEQTCNSAPAGEFRQPRATMFKPGDRVTDTLSQYRYIRKYAATFLLKTGWQAFRLFVQFIKEGVDILTIIIKKITGQLDRIEWIVKGMTESAEEECRIIGPVEPQELFEGVGSGYIHLACTSASDFLPHKSSICL